MLASLFWARGAWKAGGGAGVAELTAAEILGLRKAQTWSPRPRSQAGMLPGQGAMHQHSQARACEWGHSFLCYQMKGSEEIGDLPHPAMRAVPLHHSATTP